MDKLIQRCLVKGKFILAKLITRKRSVPLLVALLPQDRCSITAAGAKSSGFSIIYLPFADEIRNIETKFIIQPGKVHLPAFIYRLIIYY